MRRMKIGIVGCGVISNTYIRDIKRLFPEMEISFVADADETRARDMAKKYDIPGYGYLQKLLENPEVEIVVNLTPPKNHTEVNLQILNAGKHLFCEKPFALKVEEAREVYDFATKKGLQIGCAPDSFMGSSLRTCKKILDDKWIGKPLYVCMNMMNAGVETWHPFPENFYREGGGPIYDMGGYYFTALVYLFGAVKSVYAASGKGFEKRTIYTKERFLTEFPVEVPTHYAAIVTMENGMIVNANFSFDIYKTSMPMFEVYGTDGTLSVPDPNMHGGTPKVFRKEQKLSENYEGEARGGDDFFEVPEAFMNVGMYVRGLGVKDLSNAILQNKIPEANAELAIHVLDVLTSLLQSAQTGKTVELSTHYSFEQAGV